MNDQSRPTSVRGIARSRVALLGAIAMCALVPPRAAAQEELSMTRREILVELFGNISPNAELRVVTIGGTVEEGRLQGVEPGAVAVLREGSTHAVEYQDVRSVQLEGGHGVQGAVWGAASGAVVGIFFGAMFASFDCTTPEDCNYTEKEGAWRWGTFLAGIGGGVGFVLGRRSLHFHPIFP